MVVLPFPAWIPEIDGVWERQVDVPVEVIERALGMRFEDPLYGCRGEVGVYVATEEGLEV